MKTPGEFWAKVSYRPGPGCWEWAGASRGKAGYGSVWWNGKTEYAHRVSYVLAGGSLDAGLVIDHLCRNPKCCRPSHLEAVSPSTNVRRGVRPAQAAAEMKRRAAERTHCSNGHPWESNERVPKAGGRYCLTCRRELARKYRSERKAA